jgi:ATPase family associated with various cellular activities (AAA)
MTSAVQFGEQVRMAEPPFMALVRLRARRRTLWLRELWSGETNVRDLAITDDETDRILADPVENAQAEVTFYESNAKARELSRLCVLADKEAESDPLWTGLRRCFDLSQTEADLLALTATVVADPAFARACGYLQDDASACFATQALAAALFDWNADEHVLLDSPLARWRLAFVPEHAAYSAASTVPWVADPAIVQWLLGFPLNDPLLRTAIRRSGRDVAEMQCLYPDTRNAMREFIVRVRSDSVARSIPIEIELIGPEGSGKRTLAAQCVELCSDLLAVDARVLFTKEASPAQMIERAVHAARAARLQSAVLYFDHAEIIEPQVRSAIEGLCDLILFAGPAPLSSPTAIGAVRQVFHVHPLTQAQRGHLWQGYTREPLPEAIRDWNLRPAEIRAAAQISCAGPHAVLTACRQMLHHASGQMFSPLPCPYTWDDIVLPLGVRKQLEELCSQARLRGQVLEEWGFERLCRVGRGISALFAGPSGTGKTMAAQVLAGDLNRELLRVDLAEVVNKYIGETEKRLKQVFEVCERSPVVLFFDEADALFGQRTQVKDAHDRYANIQIDYLLQRMEQFDGIAILATNRKNDLDAAFLRRLRFIVDFVPPGPPERLALWRLALVERSPAGDELLDAIDWNWLAENLIMTGSDIKATVLAAAFLARTEASRIRMEHLLHAAKREMTKHGTSWRVAEWSPSTHG